MSRPSRTTDAAPRSVGASSSSRRIESMGRNTGPKWKLSRREGMDLFSRGAHGSRGKSPLAKRDYPPGVHAQSRRKISEYGIRLREKPSEETDGDAAAAALRDARPPEPVRTCIRRWNEYVEPRRVNPGACEVGRRCDRAPRRPPEPPRRETANNVGDSSRESVRLACKVLGPSWGLSQTSEHRRAASHSRVS